MEMSFPLNDANFPEVFQDAAEEAIRISQLTTLSSLYSPGARIGIDGVFLLRRARAHLVRSDPFWFASSTIPPTLSAFLSDFITCLHQCGLIPVLVFDGMHTGITDISSGQIGSDDIWSAVDPPGPAGKFSFLLYRRAPRRFEEEVVSWTIRELMRLSTEEAPVEVYTAPYLAWSQLATFAHPSEQYVSGLIGEQELLMLEHVDSVITWMDIDDSSTVALDDSKSLASSVQVRVMTQQNLLKAFQPLNAYINVHETRVVFCALALFSTHTHFAYGQRLNFPKPLDMKEFEVSSSNYYKQCEIVLMYCPVISPSSGSCTTYATLTASDHLVALRDYFYLNIHPSLERAAYFFFLFSNILRPQVLSVIVTTRFIDHPSVINVAHRHAMLHKLTSVRAQFMFKILRFIRRHSPAHQNTRLSWVVPGSSDEEFVCEPEEAGIQPPHVWDLPTQLLPQKVDVMSVLPLVGRIVHDPTEMEGCENATDSNNSTNVNNTSNPAITTKTATRAKQQAQRHEFVSSTPTTTDDDGSSVSRLPISPFAYTTHSQALAATILEVLDMMGYIGVGTDSSVCVAELSDIGKLLALGSSLFSDETLLLVELLRTHTLTDDPLEPMPRQQREGMDGLREPYHPTQQQPLEYSRSLQQQTPFSHYMYPPEVPNTPTLPPSKPFTATPSSFQENPLGLNLAVRALSLLSLPVRSAAWTVDIHPHILAFHSLARLYHQMLRMGFEVHHVQQYLEGRSRVPLTDYQHAALALPMGKPLSTYAGILATYIFTSADYRHVPRDATTQTEHLAKQFPQIQNMSEALETLATFGDIYCRVAKAMLLLRRQECEQEEEQRNREKEANQGTTGVTGATSSQPVVTNHGDHQVNYPLYLSTSNTDEEKVEDWKDSLEICQQDEEAFNASFEWIHKELNLFNKRNKKNTENRLKKKKRLN